MSVTAALVALAGTGWPVSAQVGVLPSSTTSSSTTTTAAAEEPATTTTTAPPAVTPPSSSTTTAPPPSSSTTTTTEAAPPLLPTESTTTTTQPPAATQPLPPGSGDGTAPTGDAGEFPPELRALTNSVRRSSANNTRKLLEALAPLQQYGMNETETAIVGFGRFPVAGYASYVHDWWFPRFGPGWRLHEGTDIFAARGTPVRAPVDGHVRITNGGLGGLAVYVVQADGTYYYMAHLAAPAEGLAEGQPVVTGQVVGYVGDSGNARGGLPHLHFEIHPRGGPAIDPKPVLDQFIADAVTIAPRVVEVYAARAAREAQAVQAAAAPPAEVAEVPIVAPRSALLWASSFNPAGGALQLVEAEAARATAAVDWDSRQAAEQALRARHEQFSTLARALLTPLVPAALAAALA